ncbi:MAG: hypothetical protein ABI972_03795 [Acidobacteriota bacterium]
MSTRVLVIPEDATYNGYVVKPLVERIFREIGTARAQVNVCRTPAVHGKDTVRGLLPEILDRHPHTDLFLYFQDSDLQPTEGAFQYLERIADRANQRLICVAAQPELEIYPLASVRAQIQTELGIGWPELRNHHRLKEECFEVMADRLRLAGGPGKGRLTLMQQALQNYRGLEAICEELVTLRERIAEFLESQRAR